MFEFFKPVHPASSNIQDYIARTTLPDIILAPTTPPMPPPEHKSHRNVLSTRPELSRKLEQMHLIQESVLNDAIFSFMVCNVPSWPLNVDDTDPRTGDKIALPCPGYSIYAFQLPRLTHIEELGVTWLYQSVLCTMQRIVQLLPGFTLTAQWAINWPDDAPDDDHPIFRYFTWNKSSDPLLIAEPSDPCSLVIAYQPPWILSPHDLKQFVRTASLPMYNRRDGTCAPRFNSAQRVWAKLWDICRRKNTHYFVLTCYSEWVFGCFSRGWQRGFVSEIIKSNSVGPTVLQYLLYWFASSMFLPDISGFSPPDVPEPVEYLDPSLPIPDRTQNGVRIIAPDGCEPSESCWTGQSMEPASSAGIVSDAVADSPQYEVDTHTSRRPHEPTFFPASRNQSIDFVQRWLEMETPLPMAPTPLPDQPSPVPSNWTTSSTATTICKPINSFLSIVPPVGPEDSIYF